MLWFSSNFRFSLDFTKICLQLNSSNLVWNILILIDFIYKIGLVFELILLILSNLSLIYLRLSEFRFEFSMLYLVLFTFNLI